MDLVWTWYGDGMEMVWSWYGDGIEMVWTKSGGNPLENPSKISIIISLPQDIPKLLVMIFLKIDFEQNLQKH